MKKRKGSKEMMHKVGTTQTKQMPFSFSLKPHIKKPKPKKKAYF
jgi:hypothetical protein